MSIQVACFSTYCFSLIYLTKANRLSIYLQIFAVTAITCLVVALLMQADFMEYAMYLAIVDHIRNYNLIAMTLVAVMLSCLFRGISLYFRLTINLLPVLRKVTAAIHRKDIVFIDRHLSDKNRPTFKSKFRAIEHFTRIYMRNFNYLSCN